MKKTQFIFVVVTILSWLFVPLSSWANNYVAVVTLNPTGDADSSGGAVISVTSDGRVIVDVLVTGIDSGNHANHIHQGTCANQGGIVHNLLDITADSAGTGAQVTVLQLLSAQLQDLVSSSHYVNIHEFSTDGGIGGGITCGDITFTMLP
jgi:hypothetical protein